MTFKLGQKSYPNMKGRKMAHQKSGVLNFIPSVLWDLSPVDTFICFVRTNLLQGMEGNHVTKFRVVTEALK